MNVYVNGLGNVSPQFTLNNDEFLIEIRNEKVGALWCIIPDFKSMLPGLNLRRMSRLLKNGIYSAQQCINDAEESNLDAIITGTGLGCQEDTEKFLASIYGNEEGIVSPTQFIQSTHNAISAQIALMLQCKNYNFTYAHRGASFESALMDAMMLIEDNARHVLVGGLDELTDNYLAITNRMKLWKNETINQLDLIKKESKGSIPGEGASFFMLGKEPGKHCYAKIKGIRILFKPKSYTFIKAEIKDLLSQNGLDISDIDISILGMNGNPGTDAIYKEFQEDYFLKTNLCYYKHLCGEYKTASAFGLWTACQIMQKQHVPDILKLEPFEQKEIRNILIYNNYNNSNHSMLLIQNVEA